MSIFSDKQAAANDLRQVVAYILDTTAMAATITSVIEGEINKFAQEMQEIEMRYSGFTKRLHRKIAKEVQRIISQRVPDLQYEFVEFLSYHLTPDDISAVLQFQRHYISGQLRDPGFTKLLETNDISDVSLSERMLVQMRPRQHAFVTAFLKSPCSLKLSPLTGQMEKLKYEWMQEIANGLSQRLPVTGNEILLKHYTRQN